MEVSNSTGQYTHYKVVCGDEESTPKKQRHLATFGTSEAARQDSLAEEDFRSGHYDMFESVEDFARALPQRLREAGEANVLNAGELPPGGRDSLPNPPAQVWMVEFDTEGEVVAREVSVKLEPVEVRLSGEPGSYKVEVISSAA